MSQSTDGKDHANDDMTNNDADLVALDINAAESIDDEIMDTFYPQDKLRTIMMATLDYIDERIHQGLTLPYFEDIEPERWQSKTKALDIYITDEIEGQALNLEARNKDYATNILSYPSDLPLAIIELMPTLPLGELIICHDVMVREAKAQNKAVEQHISHLLIHGILHLLGFDHELGQTEQDEMEKFEIAILAKLGLPNPYI
ncbi:rRNA maturation RNase YbeY [Psychrobacter sp. JB385]|uniref:rRNA maturation RNase YbeY n=1 Tax=Psychrobacter sp. JB385 TaxID=1434841 RepID=UPI00097F0D1E|nr:rRNA maturation RNase YbeY [Psychrobacter sp. JB385]SJN32888.1 Metal-dependent hydrolase YbeY, involved in rRNA and/or ribosome maturation and assembly [Psychrobacter sp. JB385]